MKSYTHLRKAIMSLGTLVVFAMTVGCGDTSTEVDELTIADMAGSWAGSQFAITSDANPAMSFDLIGGGGTVVVAMQPQGNFTGTAVLPGVLLGSPGAGVVSVPLAGVMRLVDETTMRIDFIPEIPPLFVTLNPDFAFTGSTLTITDEEVEFDFDQDGVKEPAVFRGILVRN